MSRRRSRGSVLTETALTIPVFLFVVFGIIEGGLAFRDRLTTTSAAHDAARAATVKGNELFADEHVLAVLDDSASPLKDDAIVRVVVFKASGPGDDVPTNCLTNSVIGLCNLYLPADFGQPQTEFGCRADKDLDRYWCPLDRVIIQTAANGGPPDYVGVHVEIQRESLTGLIPATTMASTRVLRIEPRDR